MSQTLSTSFKILISSALLCYSASAFAVGDEVQNGGDVIACPSYEVPFYKSLDLYEGEVVYNLVPVATSSNDHIQILNQVIDRIAKFDSVRAGLYRSYLKALHKEARMVPSSVFSDIRDEGFNTIPEGCELKQAAAQFRSYTPDGVKYIFNQALWNEMNARTRAGLVMHEFVYREGLLPKNNFKTSAKVRYFNAFVHSQKMLKGTKADYDAAVKFTGFKN